MAFVIGNKTIKRCIEFEAEGDLGEQVPCSFVLVMERPDKPTSKAFSLLFARFADVLSQQGKPVEGEPFLMEQFTERVDAAEQELSDFVRGKISGWEDVSGQDNQPLACTTENLQALFADREARRAVFDNYHALVTSRKKDAEKNSDAPESTGTT